MTTTTFRHAALALAASLFAAAAAHAQSKPPREATLGGGGASGGPTLTREQLRQCLVEQDALKTTRDGLAGETQAIDAEKAEITRAGAALKEALDKLDRSSADAVQAHVAEAQAHDQRIEAWNAKLAPFNERVQALQRRNEAWKGDCADRRYREDDLILLQARKQVPAAAR